MIALGLDIGGANIKVATSDGGCFCRAFAIWQNKNGLLQELKQLPLLAGTQPEIVALTMTAELADCFESKAEGVEFIVRTVAEAFPDSVLRVWMTSGEFAGPGEAIELSQLVAAANWHALATWAGRAVPSGAALLVDVGSTTTDVIPLVNGIPCSEGLTDLQRLAHSELIYTGVRRTPVCAIVRSVPLMHETALDATNAEEAWMVPVAAELFATSLDSHLVNGDIPEDPQDRSTADYRPATRAAAANRLRMLSAAIAMRFQTGSWNKSLGMSQIGKSRRSPMRSTTDCIM
ncbi:MAG: hydantoinase/oxoprolinase family protein [Planctomycetaceae bacterium]